MVVELCGAVRAGVPSFFRLLEHSDSEVRWTAVSLLERLADHSIVHPHIIAVYIANSDIAKLRKAIGVAILALVNRLEDRDANVRLSTVSALNRFSDYGESHLDASVV